MIDKRELEIIEVIKNNRGISSKKIQKKHFSAV